MFDDVILVHSPLLGPSSWAPLVSALEATGAKVSAPDLTTAVDGWDTFSRRAAEVAPPTGTFAVMGHSGTGALLPVVAGILGSDRVDALVFIDAVVPPEHGVHRTSESLTRLLDEQTVNGVLRPWLDWWPEAAIGRMLPDPAQVAALRADMPQVARSFYDAAIPMPAGWSAGPCAYVRLSPAYDTACEEAARRGWPWTVVDGHHLSAITEPDRVLAAIEEVVDALW